MGFKSDIEIAQETEMLHIREIAKIAGVDEKYLEQYGNYKAKVDYNILKDMADKPDGKPLLRDNQRNLSARHHTDADFQRVPVAQPPRFRHQPAADNL